MSSKKVLVKAVLSIDHAGQIFRIVQNGRQYDIYNPINIGNVEFAKIKIDKKVKGKDKSLVYLPSRTHEQDETGQLEVEHFKKLWIPSSFEKLK